MDAMLITIFCAVVYLIYKFIFKNYSYWSDKGVNGPKPIPLVGTFPNILFRKESIGRAMEKVYKNFTNEKVIGGFILRKPVLVLKDLDIIKQVLIKDFDNFVNRGISNENNIFHENLLLAEDDRWRLLRQKLTPVFTSGKLKNMFYLITKCANQLDNYIEHLIDGSIEHEIRALTGKYTLEAIGNCAFGIEINGFHDGENIYYRMGNRFFENDLRIALINMLDDLFPGILKKFKIKTDKTDAVAFFLDLVDKLLKEREGKEKVRHDFMDLLIEMREKGSIKGNLKHGEYELEMTDVLIAAQSVIFFSAGFETSSSTMTFTIHELAKNPGIQEKAREEVDAIYKKYGEITYESLKEMNYLEMVLQETLRKYPVAEVLARRCEDKYTFPETNITIDKGIKVFVPIAGLHHDPEYYPEPEKFIPERFTAEEKQSRHPCAYIPFGEGPRICIGMRFARVQSMVGLATILHKFRIIPSKKMMEPIKFNPLSTTLQAIHGVWVEFERR